MTTAAEIARDIAKGIESGALVANGRFSPDGVLWLEIQIKEAVKTLTHLRPVDDFTTIGEAARGVLDKAQGKMNGR